MYSVVTHFINNISKKGIYSETNPFQSWNTLTKQTPPLTFYYNCNDDIIKIEANFIFRYKNELLVISGNSHNIIYHDIFMSIHALKKHYHNMLNPFISLWIIHSHLCFLCTWQCFPRYFGHVVNLHLTWICHGDKLLACKIFL